jgi:hypothetical protein
VEHTFHVQQNSKGKENFLPKASLNCTGSFLSVGGTNVGVAVAAAVSDMAFALAAASASCLAALFSACSSSWPFFFLLFSFFFLFCLKKPQECDSQARASKFRILRTKEGL